MYICQQGLYLPLLSAWPALHSSPALHSPLLSLPHLISGIGRKLSTEQFLSFKAAGGGGAADIKPWTSWTSWFDLLPSRVYLVNAMVTQAAAYALY